MGKRSINHHHHHHVWAQKSQTLPPSPSHSSSSSDFEFTISASPRNKSSSALCPADELFYKGKLLPLHTSPRLSMVRTLLLASSSTSSSSDSAGTSTTASRDSTGSSNDSHSELVLLAESEDSSRRASSVDEEPPNARRYFSLARLFKKEPNRQLHHPAPQPDSSVRRISAVAKEVIRKYLKKVKPLYEKISQKQQQQKQQKMLGRLTTVPASSTTTATNKAKGSVKGPNKKEINGGRSGGFSHSFSGNLRYPRRKSSISSCPSSIRSSPSHSSVLCRPKGIMYNNNSLEQTTSSSMDELQSAIQGAIAHCKNSLLPHNNNKSTMMRSMWEVIRATCEFGVLWKRALIWICFLLY